MKVSEATRLDERCLEIKIICESLNYASGSILDRIVFAMEAPNNLKTVGAMSGALAEFAANTLVARSAAMAPAARR